MPDRTYNVLFLCTGNSCRSIIAECLLNHLGQGRYKGYSAGSHPAGRVNPSAVQALNKRGLPTDGLRSKNWGEFEVSGAPVMDLIITVCDNAAGETCPVWPGGPVSAHWGLADPALFTGNGEETAAVFDDTLDHLERLIRGFLDLPKGALSAVELNGLLGKTPA
ncbi:MAG TPA: arsenate reductase ArsC [Rhodospirillales bacterium]|nr:arsenate reductase ArsC [Rhodospirillales bacterium]